MKVRVFESKTIDRMTKPVFHSAAFVISLLLTTSVMGAGQPCAPFEGGDVDPKILASMRAAAAQGRLYRVDPDVSAVGFCVRHFPLQEFRGEFTDLVGGLAFPQTRTQYGQALLLIFTPSLKSRNAVLEHMVKGPRFMDTANHPEILYVGRRFEWVNQVHAHIYGELTVRGKMHPVMFDVDIDIPDDSKGKLPDRIRMRGRSQVSRFKYDMRSHRFFVSETIKLCLVVEVVRDGF